MDPLDPGWSDVILLLLWFASYLLVPLVVVLSIAGWAVCAIRRKRPSGFLVAATCAAATIPLYWVVVVRLDLHPLFAAVLAFLLAIGFL